MTLHLADGLTLPDDAVTETFVILGKRGSGKTSTAVVMVEEMISSGLPVVVVDPIGVWWGLRTSVDGAHDGLPVVIFGGEHADLPLGEHSGIRLADVLIEHRPPAVLDLSDLSKSSARRFMADFTERLYHRNRRPLHLVLDEADLWAPQRPSGEPGGHGPRLLGAIEDTVRRGRARGLGCSLITQRPAVLHKDVLSQAEVLVALRMTGVRDVQAIDEWVRLHDTDEQAGRVKGSLASLPVGTAWIWSPGWLGLLQQVPIRPRCTFDSSATPKVGEDRVEPQRFAQVDLDALRTELAGDTTSDDTSNDDGRLRRELDIKNKQLATQQHRISELERQLEDARRAQVDRLRECLTGMRTIAGELLDAVQAIDSSMLTAAPGPRRTSPVVRPVSSGPAELDVPSSAVDVHLKAGARRMLDTLGRHHPMRVTRSQLATLARFKVTGGTFSSYYSALRRAGLIDELDSTVGLTSAGLDATGAHGQPATPDELLEQWRGVLKAGARAMLDELVRRYPKPASRLELAQHAGLEVTGGTFGTYLGMLRRNGLVTVDGDQITASDTLFLGTVAVVTR